MKSTTMDCHPALIALLIFWMNVKEAECKQQFHTKPVYTEVNPGQTAILNCRITDIGGQCSWQKDRKPIRMFPQKYDWVGDNSQGECSIKIINANLTYDDGIWECQVTPTALDTMDSLSSEPVKLVVRVRPQEPLIEYNTSRLERGRNLTNHVEHETVVKCLSRYGNPAATIRWYLGDDDITSYSRYSNSSEADLNRTWLAVSVLQYTFQREQNGKSLRCLAFHEAYQEKSKEISVQLNVQYPPIVKYRGKPNKELEENKDSLNLKCSADSNPPANVNWKKIGNHQQFTDTIEFSPLTRNHSGVYRCEARNILGESFTETVEIDVKYPPKIKRINPTRDRVALSNRTTLSCLAEGNPPPEYEWLHSLTGNPESALLVGQQSTLVIDNTTYDNQGKYVCAVTNMINSEKKRIQSQEVTIEVYGRPQVLSSRSSKSHLVVDKGVDAVIRIPFCSKPQPSKLATWEWGSLILPVGEAVGTKFISKQLKEMQDIKGCFNAELTIQKVETTDSRRYSLRAENSYGNMKHSVFLNVQEPIAMLTVIGIVIGCLIILLFTILILLYAFRSEKWCFQKKQLFTNKDNESEINGKELPTDTRGCITSGAIPPDALYTIPPKTNSNERCDDVSEYDSMMSDHNETRRPNNQEVVYADLDIIQSKAPSSKSKIIRRESPTEYAHIQVQYRPKPNEQADI